VKGSCAQRRLIRTFNLRRTPWIPVQIKPSDHDSHGRLKGAVGAEILPANDCPAEAFILPSKKFQVVDLDKGLFVL